MNAALPQPRRPRPLAPLATRRRVVLTASLGYALFLLTVTLDSVYGLPDVLLLVCGVGGTLLTFLGGVQLLRPARLGLPEGGDRHLDERQWQRLSQAHITAYRLLGAVFLLAVLYFLMAFKNHLPVPSSSLAWMSISLGAILFIPSLPNAVLAWTEPDAERVDG